MKKNAGSALMQLLKEKGKTTHELAIALDVNERTVFYWLSGDRVPRFTLFQVRDLCDFFSCSFEELPLDFSRNVLEDQN